MESKSALSWMLLSAWVLSAASAVLENITAAPGQTVSLPCRAPSNTDIIVVEWTRPELTSDYVALYRDKKLVPDLQHLSFQGRVELQDRQMKDGDVSILLRNVTRDDSGTYECRVVLGNTKHRKRANLPTEPISIVHLEVQSGHTEETGDEEGGDKGQWIALPAGLSTFLVLAFIAVFITCKLCKKGHKDTFKSCLNKMKMWLPVSTDGDEQPAAGTPGSVQSGSPSPNQTE
ncbi:hypothetical protein INR49_001233 [Caranx melampygus]|nr:hypothetical protein INR49_001233 [Caranx melampygus]